MDRRTFVKSLPIVTVAGAAATQNSDAQAAVQQAAAQSGNAKAAPSKDGIRHLLTKRPGTPDYVGYLKETDMDGIGPDGKPVPGYKAAGAGSTPKINLARPGQATQDEADQGRAGHDGRKTG